MIDFAQSIPASVKMRITDEQSSQTTEKWILREACKDLLPHDLVWREKAQFDEGTGTVSTLDEALAIATGAQSPVDRQTEAQLYHKILLDQFDDPQMILQNAGTGPKIASPSGTSRRAVRWMNSITSEQPHYGSRQHRLIRPKPTSATISISISHSLTRPARVVSSFLSSRTFVDWIPIRSKTPDLAITRDDERLLSIAERAGDMTVVVGFVEEGWAAQFHNSAAALRRGKVEFIHRKLNLATYRPAWKNARHRGEGEELVIADLEYDKVRQARFQLPTVRDSNLDLIHREIERLNNRIGVPREVRSP